MNQDNVTVVSDASELQTMIADSVDRLFGEQVTADLLREFDSSGDELANGLWQQATELGLDQALVPADAGGSGATWQEVWPILRALGYWQAPLPLAETMLANLLLARAGIAADLSPGTRLAIIEAGRHGDLRIEASAGGHTVSGTALGIAWARACRWAVVSSGRESELIALVDLHQQTAVQIVPADNLAAEASDGIRFDNAKVHATGTKPFGALHEPVWIFGALMRSAMMVGALERVLDESVSYANERKQFGRPLAKFQAIQQALAELAGALGSARVAVQVAFATAPTGTGDPGTLAFDVAVAKVRTGEAATRCNAIAHQVFGAIGFTQEHHLHFATRRLWSWRAEFGSDAQWAEALGKAAIAAGSQGFWPGLTARTIL